MNQFVLTDGFMQVNDAREQLFPATDMKTDSEGEDLAYLRRSLEIQGKKSLDLVQFQRLADFNEQWQRLWRWREKGSTRLLTNKLD